MSNSSVGVGMARSLLRPLHLWVWRDAERRAGLLSRFAETEADGGRDIARAAETTSDPILRRLYLRHAMDEQRHSERLRGQSAALRLALPHRGLASDAARWPVSGERGLDDLRVDEESDEALLAFLHLSEKDAASAFAAYRDVLDHDPATRAVFDDILRDERSHMTYTLSELARVAPRGYRRRLWRARMSRLWKGYLRLAMAVAGAISTVVLMVQYFVLLPPFAFMAKRAARRETPGWVTIPSDRPRSLKSQY